MDDQAMQTAQLTHWSSSAYQTPPQSAERAEPTIRFGDFVAFPASRSVLRQGSPVPIGSRAFDLLMVLLRSQGIIVTKAEIVRQVWPSMIVEDGNLRFQITMLRRALGAERDRIKTIPGRGYLFVPDSGDREYVREFRQAALPGAIDRDRQTASAENPAIVIMGAGQEVCKALHLLLRSLGLHVAAFDSIKALLENQSPGAAMQAVTSGGDTAWGLDR